MGFGEMREKLLQEELGSLKSGVNKIQEVCLEREREFNQERESY